MLSVSSTRRPPWWVLGVIVVQLTVPAYALVVGEQPRRLGFQMYSGLENLAVTATDSNGDELALPEALTAHLRPDLPWLESLPEQICDVGPAPTTVTVTHRSVVRTVTC